PYSVYCTYRISFPSRRPSDLQANPKRQAVVALKSLYYRVIATGDSYNDTTMLAEADAGILFHAPDNVIREFPQFPAVHTYADLKDRKSTRLNSSHVKISYAVF